MGILFSSNSSAAVSTSSWTAEGMNVLITGASSGIGSELARTFSREGASIALVARSKDKLLQVAKECKELGATRTEIFLCDMTDDSQIKKAIVDEALEQFGRFDVVILNAGRSQGCYFEEINDVDSINYMLKLNVNGVITTLYHLLPSVPKSSSSRIVVISSVSGLIPVPYRTIYCASKHALNGFANALRLELNDTYGNDAPAIQVINFPEVQGTDLNSGRMDFGADVPPVEFITKNVVAVEKACSLLMMEIAEGTREWGQPLKVKMLLPLWGFVPSFIDRMIMKTVKKTHFRPNILVRD
mmetsp:Transcript_13334/g.19973  ORF Transcript_13334/g.19973 Transcript_13334/m.19973 type:complete len:300 (-) Transcript_13334:256-1155(-)